MSSVLQNRVAIVTGGARGIGLALAKCFAAEGAKVVIADNGTGIDGEGADPKVAQDAAKEIGEAAIPFTESIASPQAAKAAVDTAVKKFGGVDILVNNAAILRDALVFKGDPLDWDAVIHNNLSAAYYLTNAATPVMREQAKAGRPQKDGGYVWGRVINIGSTAGLYGNFGQASYAAAKAGLMALTRVTAMEMIRSNVTANYIAPFAHTRVTDIIHPANEEQAQYKDRAMRIDPGHVARFAAYLASEKAGDITGQVFGVRGREVFLFSQPRPVAHFARKDHDWAPTDFDQPLRQDMGGQFVDLTTDLEYFNTEPFV